MFKLIPGFRSRMHSTLLLVAALSLLTACGDKADTARKGPGKRPAQLVALAPVVAEAIQHHSERTGTLKAHREVRIFNQEEGSLTEVPFYEGDRVSKGDVLLRIDDKLLRAQLDKANATLAQTRDDLKRLQKLRKRKLVADEEVTRARTALDVAEAEQRLLATRIGYTTVTSPIDGIVSERRVEPGDVAPRHTHLLTLIDTQTLITEVAVSGLLIPSLKKGDPVDIRIDALPERKVTGSILRIHPTLNKSTRNGIVEVILEPAPAGARPGQLCRVSLLSGSEERRLIPFAALRHDSDGSYVFTVTDKNKVKRTNISTGLRFADRIEVLDGLEAGQQVVIKGFLGLKEGKTIRTVSAANDRKDP